MEPLEKLHPTIGVFGGIYDEDGRILLRQRGEGETFPGEYELPGGAVYLHHAVLCQDERLIREALARRIEAEIGIPEKVILDMVQPMPAMYPAVLGGGADIDFAIIIGQLAYTPEFKAKGKVIFVGVDELCSLADDPEGNRLLSGRKRMFRMCLRMFASRDCPNGLYRAAAGKLLQDMHKEVKASAEY